MCIKMVAYVKLRKGRACIVHTVSPLDYGTRIHKSQGHVPG